MPVIKNKTQIEKEIDENEVVSAYSPEGKKRNENQGKSSFSLGFKILYFLCCVIGLIVALIIVYLIEKYE